MKKLGLYIHIPFCARKCLYCDFCSHTDCPTSVMHDYAAAAVGQINLFSKLCASEYLVDSIYFGGGTPTLLPVSEFEILLSAINSGFTVDKDAEITVECNPATVDKSYLLSLRRLEVNRLSIGAQSMNDTELRALGRLHDSKGFLDTFAAARAAGFENISVDLMYGIPGQSRGSFLVSLRRVLSLSPEHVSAYALKLEEGTPLFHLVQNKAVNLPDDDETADMYEAACAELEAYGLFRYEISNFAKRGYESRHNLRYWMCEEYIGIGIAAHSFFRGERFFCHESLGDYIRGVYVDSGSRRALSESELETEYVMLSMRTSRGLQADEYRMRFMKNPFEKYDKRFSEYIRSGLVERDEDGFRFTTRGMLLSNSILSTVLDL